MLLLTSPRLAVTEDESAEVERLSAYMYCLRGVCSAVVPLARYYANYPRRAEWDQTWRHDMKKGEKLEVRSPTMSPENLALSFSVSSGNLSTQILRMIAVAVVQTYVSAIALGLASQDGRTRGRSKTIPQRPPWPHFLQLGRICEAQLPMHQKPP